MTARQPRWLSQELANMALASVDSPAETLRERKTGVELARSNPLTSFVALHLTHPIKFDLTDP